MLTGELPIGRFAAPSKKVEIDVASTKWFSVLWKKSPSYAISRPGTSRPAWNRLRIQIRRVGNSPHRRSQTMHPDGLDSRSKVRQLA